MWIGLRQWEDLPGEFDVGQTDWVYPKGNSAEFFFVPAFSSRVALSYKVFRMAEGFLRFTTLENA